MNTWVEVNLSAIKSNAQAIRQHAQGRQLIAVIKADAYGHGAVRVAQALDAEAAMYAVATVDEGVALREAGIDKPLLILFSPLPEQAEVVARYELTPAAHEPLLCRALSQCAKTLGNAVRVHVAVNTGMNRDGIWHEDAIGFVKWLNGLEGIEVEGIFTHFANADDLDVALQLARFSKLLAALTDRNLKPPIVHAANSAATLMFPETHFDAVRVGLSLYGVYPSRQIASRCAVALQPALVWKARVIWQHRPVVGEGVSYGHTYRIGEPTQLATVAIGYADGYPRALSNRGIALIGGERAQLAGRVCMDATVFRLAPTAKVAVGDEATLIGKELPVDDIAETANTIPYEILTGIGRRVRRVYVE